MRGVGLREIPGLGTAFLRTDRTVQLRFYLVKKSIAATGTPRPGFFAYARHKRRFIRLRQPRGPVLNDVCRREFGSQQRGWSSRRGALPPLPRALGQRDRRADRGVQAGDGTFVVLGGVLHSQSSVADRPGPAFADEWQEAHWPCGLLTPVGHAPRKAGA